MQLNKVDPIRLIGVFKHTKRPASVVLNLSSVNLGRRLQLPTLDGILAFADLVHIYKMERNPERHGVPIPLTPVSIAHKFMFATTYPLLHLDDGRNYTYFTGKYCRLDVDSKKIYLDENDRLDLRRISQPVLWTSRAYDRLAEYKHKPSVKIAGKRYTVQGGRGPFQNRMIYYTSISADLFYLAYGHPPWIRKYLSEPLGVGYNYSSPLISAELYEHDVGINDIFTAERIGGDGYVLLRSIPVKAFKKNEVVKAEYKAVRTQPPYHFDKNKPLCIGEGSIVRRKPRIHLLSR